MSQLSNNYTLGRGEIHFARFIKNTRIPDAFLYIGNTPSFGLTIESETLDHFSSDHGIKEKDASIVLEVNRTGTLTTDNISHDNIALFFFGSVENIATTASSDNTITLTSVRQGASYNIGTTSADPTGAMLIDPTNFVVTNNEEDQGLQTFSVNEDYELEEQPGIIKIVEDGAIQNDSTIKLTWNVLAGERSRVISGSTAVEGAMRYVSTNPSGSLENFYMPYVKISPNGDWSLKGDDWQELPMNIEVLTLDKKTPAIMLDGEAMFTN